MFGWFSTKEETAFGESLADCFAAQVPAATDFKDKKYKAQAQPALNDMAAKVNQFKDGRQLNLLKKAQLGNAFKWKLRDAGYDHGYVDELTEWLMLRF